MKRLSLFIVLLGLLFPVMSLAMDHTKPQLLEDKFYKEYWEQHFLFEDGTFVTAQFLVANFPWPVGKDHGIMIATVVSPEGERTIIKNGRNPGEWGFDPDKFSIFIHTHRLKSENGVFDLHLGSDDGNAVNATFTSKIPSFDHEKFTRKKGSMKSSVYLPFFEGSGQWQIYQGKDKPLKKASGKIQGFATHTITTGRLETVLKNWLRVNGLGREDGQAVPFLSARELPDGTRDIILALKKPDGTITEFSNVTIDYRDIKKEGKYSSYPTIIKVKGEKGAESLSGTIRLSRKIDHFNIYDHLNFFERSFAMSRASVTNYRYIADYDLDHVTASGIQKLTGKALSEYQDILQPRKKKKKRKRRRR